MSRSGKNHGDRNLSGNHTGVPGLCREIAPSEQCSAGNVSGDHRRFHLRTTHSGLSSGEEVPGRLCSGKDVGKSDREYGEEKIYPFLNRKEKEPAPKGTGSKSFSEEETPQ